MSGLRNGLSAALLLLLAAVSLTAFAAPVAAATAEASGPETSVRLISVCRGIDRETRAPDGAAEAFPADVGRLWCFTRVTGAVDSTAVTHVWYHGGEVMARVELPVRSADWRTWSSKTILPGWTGDWEVKALDPDGVVLAAYPFRVTEPVPAPAAGEGE